MLFIKGCEFFSQWYACTCVYNNAVGHYSPEWPFGLYEQTLADAFVYPLLKNPYFIWNWFMCWYTVCPYELHVCI